MSSPIVNGFAVALATVAAEIGEQVGLLSPAAAIGLVSVVVVALATMFGNFLIRTTLDNKVTTDRLVTAIEGENGILKRLERIDLREATELQELRRIVREMTLGDRRQ